MRRAISKYLIRTAFASCIVIASLMLPVTIATAQSNWFWLQPLPQGNRLTSIEFADAFNGCAVGDVGAIVRTTDGGITWTKIEPPRKVNFYGVDFAKGNPLVLVAVSDSGRIYRSSDGGYKWYLAQTVTNTVVFQDVDFAGPSTAFAVGLAGRIYKSTDAGVTWNQQFSPTGLSLRSVNFWNENCGIIGGDRRVMLTSNGGANWFVQDLVLNQFDQTVGVSQLDSLTAVAAAETDGGGKSFRTTNGGVSWDTVRLNIPYPNGSGDIVRHMSFGGKRYGLICTSLGSILRTTNGGANWSRDSTYYLYYQRNFGTGIFWSTTFIDSNTAFITGGGGGILRSTNSGQNWNFAVGGVRDLHGTFFINPQTGWAVGEEGTIQRTTTGGVNWSFYPPLTRQVLREVHFPSAQTGYICGDTGVVLKTTNSGDNWFMLNSGISALLFDVQFLNNETGYIAGGFTSWDSIGIGWMRKTTDGGNNWATIYYHPDSGHVRSMHFFDEQTGVALFETAIRRTTNAGTVWYEVGTGPTGSGSAMNFVDDANGYIVGKVNSLYKSTDAGITWIPLATGYSGTLHSVQFTNVDRGIAVGYGGVILTTSNAGYNWNVTRNFTSSDLFDLYCPDSSNGYIVGSFGVIGKTTNGGISTLIESKQNIGSDFQLMQNYPNPFNSVTTLSFQANQFARVTISIFDAVGREILIPFDSEVSQGVTKIVIDMGNIPSGIYFYAMSVNRKQHSTRKMILLK